MKKFIKYIAFVLLLVFGISVGSSSKSVASAATVPVGVSYSNFSGTVNSIINEYAVFTERTPGSEGEKKAAAYIKNYINTNLGTRLIAANNGYIVDGVQTFNFEYSHSGKYEQSQNLIYTMKASTETTKKVIIGCHYDAIAFDMDLTSETYGQITASESINGSAGNVATLLALATYLPTNNLAYNIEFVFFGAGEAENAGSNYYSKGISDDEKANIICMINLNQIAFGENLYFYMDEVETTASKFVENVTYDSRVDIEKIDTVHLNKIMNGEVKELGLDYSHIALDSDNVNFMKNGVQTINIFAGDYSEGVVIGRQEFYGKDIITYTVNDNRDYIALYDLEYSISQNLYEVFKAVSVVLTDTNFMSTFEAAKGSTNWFYSIFGNQNLVLYLSAIAFVVFIVIAMFIYYKLSIKAYHANIEMEFLSSVVKITDQLDKTGKDEKVAKVVSQVIANDIKKDKVIKGKPPKDEE